MKKVAKQLAWSLAFLLICTFMLSWWVHRISEFYTEFKQEKNIWTYEFIAPKTPEFKLWEPIKMISKSIYWALGLIIWEDYLLCASDYWIDTLSDDIMDQKIKDQKHRRLETTFTQRTTTWEFWGKWDENWDGILDGEWIFWWENTIDGKKFFKTRTTWENCYIRSHQTFFYNWEPKKQNFTSWPFNIIK